MQIKVAVFSFFLPTRIFSLLIKNYQHIKGQVKKIGYHPFFINFMVGKEAFIFILKWKF